MTSRLRKLLKYLSVSVLAAGIAGIPIAASAHRDDEGAIVRIVPRGYGHGKHRGAYRYHPRFMVREYYRQPHYVYQPYYVEPRIYGYGYLPRYPSGNLSLTLDFPFHF
jgi:hypothetical protein